MTKARTKAQRRGRPRKSGKREPSKSGVVQRFYNDIVLTYDGEGCLTWPYALGGGKKPAIKFNGRMQTVARLVCEHVYGPPPTPDHQAAHSCGKGHLACVTKGHLSWKTPKENNADKITHGTVAAGERNGCAKITADQALEIRAMQGTMTQSQIAAIFKIDRTMVSLIHLRKNWAHI